VEVYSNVNWWIFPARKDDLTPTLLQIVVQLDSLIQKGNHQLFLLVYVPSYVLLGASTIDA
jgi:hypothetical protein